MPAHNSESVILGQPTTVKPATLSRPLGSARRLLHQGEGSLIKVVSLSLLVLAWWLASLTLPENILPGPGVTAATLWENAVSGVLGFHFLMTMNRIVQGFILAMLLGVVSGTFMGLWRRAEGALDLWVLVAMTIPSLCYIVVTFMWFGMNETSTVIAIALTSFPSITINVWEGVKNVDNRLVDMAKTFRTSPWRRLTRVVIPQILPYLMASARFGLGIVWKVAVVAEMLGRSNGIGFQLYNWFQLFNMPQVFAWTLFFTLIMLLIEVIVMKQLETRLFSWRPAARL